MLFLQNSDKARYGKKYNEINEACEQGHDEYPITLIAAFDMLVMKDRYGHDCPFCSEWEWVGNVGT